MIFKCIFQRKHFSVQKNDYVYLLRDIHIDDVIWEDHAWVAVNKKFENLNLKPNTQIEFEAELEDYPYNKNKKRITKIKNVKRQSL